MKKAKGTVTKEKDKRKRKSEGKERKKKAMVSLLVFIIAKKLLDAKKVHLAITFSKILLGIPPRKRYSTYLSAAPALCLNQY